MLLLRALLFVGALTVWIYCVFDVIRADTPSVHHLHKLIWLAFVVIVPTIGALAWLFLGRPEPLGSRLFEARSPMRPPDDSPEFLAGLDDEIRRRRAGRTKPYDGERTDIDEEIRRLEEELRRRAEEERGED